MPHWITQLLAGIGMAFWIGLIVWSPAQAEIYPVVNVITCAKKTECRCPDGRVVSLGSPCP